MSVGAQPLRAASGRVAGTVTAAKQLSLFDRPGAGPRPECASDLRLAVLGSGSSGNALLVEARGRRLLIDAGFSCRELERRLAGLGVEADSLEGVVLTHEHNDHARGAARLSKRHRLPVFATAGTLRERSLRGLGERARRIASGRAFEVAGFAIEPFAIPHDAREPVGLVIEDGDGCRVGVVSDLGARSQLAWGRLLDLTVLVVETNYDLEMLRSGPYPWHLKQRVASRHGHLSNRDAAEGLDELVSERLRLVVLYHLSRTNNLPALAAAAVGERLERLGSRAAVVVSEQDEASDWLENDPDRERDDDAAGAKREDG